MSDIFQAVRRVVVLFMFSSIFDCLTGSGVLPKSSVLGPTPRGNLGSDADLACRNRLAFRDQTASKTRLMPNPLGLRLRGGMPSMNVASAATLLETEEIPDLEMLKASLDPKKYPPLEPQVCLCCWQRCMVSILNR